MSLGLWKSINFFPAVSEPWTVDPSDLGMRARALNSDFEIAPDILVLFIIVTGALLVFGIWSAVAAYRETDSPGDHPAMRNLFLGVRTGLREGEHTEELQCYLRSLSLEEASIVVPKRCGPTTQFSVRLDSLPDFPTPGLSLSGQVLSCRPVRGDPKSYMVRLRFSELGDETRLPLSNYLVKLSGKQHERHLH